MKKSTKKMVGDLKLRNESYDAAIIRLIDKRTFDIVKEEIVSLIDMKEDESDDRFPIVPVERV